MKNHALKTLVAASILASSCLLCGEVLARDVKIPNTLALDNPINVGLKAFAEEVASKTNGDLTFTIIPNGVLGGDQELISQCLGGMLEAIAVGGLNAFQQQVPAMAIDNLPFMFKTAEEAYKAYDGAFGEALNSKIEPLGLKKVTFLEHGFRQITNNRKEVRSPDDLKGLKMRVPPVDIRVQTFKALGANPIPLPLPELFTALQQNAVDAEENPLTTILSMKFNEVQKYVTISNHIHDTGVLYFNKNFWDSLSPEYQKIVLEAGEVAKQASRVAGESADRDGIAKLKEYGNVVTVLTDDEHKAFVEAVQPVWDSFIEKYGDAELKLLGK